MSSAKKEASVVIAKDGPYIVTGNIPLAEQTIATDAEGGSEAWKEGTSFPAQEKYALCRCGQSKKKPFCDGTHAKIGFDGTETASRKPYLDQAQAFDGPSLALLDVEGLCAFGRFCDPHGQVWNQVSRTDDPKCARCLFAKLKIVPPAAWWSGTKQPKSRWSPSYRFRLV